jgi:parvulin-like peptidyl-prolyl isomerase
MIISQFKGIKSNYLLLTVAVIFFFQLIVLNAGNVHGVTVDRILATIGGEIITLKEYKLFVKGLEGDRNDEVNEVLLKKLIEEKIIIQEAVRKGFGASDAEVQMMVEEFKTDNSLSAEEFEKFLKEEGLTIDNYQQIARGKVLLSKIINNEVDSKVIVREEEVKEFYRNNKEGFLSGPEKVEVKAIFLKLREDASVTEITDLKLRSLRIMKLLTEGHNFDSLVDEYSDEPLKSHGGMLGIFAKGALIPSLDDRAFSMKEGEVSGPVWVSEGVYILHLISRSGVTYKLYDEVREEIYNSLYTQKRNRIYSEWLKALWEKASLIINLN